MPDLTHLWQRFLLAMALLAGLAVGIGATVFGYSNLNPVDIHFSIFVLPSVPVWAVVLVPIGLILIAGTVFHWLDSLHHFSEHMRHRRRVHELEAELARLRAHLDQVLEMPQHSDTVETVKAADTKPSLPAADMASIDAEMATLEPAADDGKMGKAASSGGASKKRAKLLPESKPEETPAPVAAAASAPINGDAKTSEPEVAATASSANDQDK